MTVSVLAQVVGLTTSSAVWVTLEKKFASHCRARVMQLKQQLHSVKKGSQSVHDYLQQIKTISNHLFAMGSPIDEDGLVVNKFTSLF